MKPLTQEELPTVKDPVVCVRCGVEGSITLFDNVGGQPDQMDEYRDCAKCGARWVIRYQCIAVSEWSA